LSTKETNKKIKELKVKKELFNIFLKNIKEEIYKTYPDFNKEEIKLIFGNKGNTLKNLEVTAFDKYTNFEYQNKIYKFNIFHLEGPRLYYTLYSNKDILNLLDRILKHKFNIDIDTYDFLLKIENSDFGPGLINKINKASKELPENIIIPELSYDDYSVIVSKLDFNPKDKNTELSKEDIDYIQNELFKFNLGYSNLEIQGAEASNNIIKSDNKFYIMDIKYIKEIFRISDYKKYNILSNILNKYINFEDNFIMLLDELTQEEIETLKND